MPTYTEARSEFNTIVYTHGTQLAIKFYSRSGATANYDDQVTWTQSGNTVWTSGMVDGVGTTSNERAMLEQGNILQDDSKVYINGSISLAGTWKLGVGSPSNRWYAAVSKVATQSYEINGQPVYHKAYVRALPNGSLYGEA